MRWSETETVKFVELYRQYDILWNVNSSNYRNKQLKLAAYQALSSKMAVEGFGVAEVKQKIKNLRCTYNQEVTKIEKSKLTGEADDVYIPSVKWFHLMDELVKNLKEHKQHMASLNTNIVYTQTPTFDDAYQEGEIEDIPYPQVEVDPILIQSHPVIESTITLGSDIGLGTAAAHKKRKQTTAAVQELRKIQQILLQPKIEDECDAFGRYVAMHLKKLPLRNSLMAQTDIQATLVRYVVAAGLPTVHQNPSLIKEELTSHEDL